ncbi:hypothetical protein Gogos_004755 [Gossypium gossypioides]|uniref:Pentatricopeptide repeat-containing protein n=1 Tax=Gossypium gossypioides TaxID=34282 RepID=A0A7J9CHC7_GOSGO|nr:hypothetical protein [Gossypium gossypioides]
MDRSIDINLFVLYFKLCTDFRETRRVFDLVLVKYDNSCTLMVSEYIKAGRPESSLQLFFELLRLGAEPSRFTLSAVIKACSVLGKLRMGCCFHAIVMKHGFHSDNVILIALIEFYGRNGQLNEMCQLFDELRELGAICLDPLSSISGEDCESTSFTTIPSTSVEYEPNQSR